MPDHNFRNDISGEDALHFLELTEVALNSKDIAELAQEVLPIIVKVMGVAGAILYFEEHIHSVHSHFQAGIQDINLQAIERKCAEQFHQIPVQTPASSRYPGPRRKMLI
jgi:hypothetical protein